MNGKVIPEEENFKEVLGPGLREALISLPKSMLMVMGLMVSAFTKYLPFECSVFTIPSSDSHATQANT